MNIVETETKYLKLTISENEIRVKVNKNLSLEEKKEKIKLVEDFIKTVKFEDKTLRFKLYKNKFFQSK